MFRLWATTCQDVLSRCFVFRQGGLFYVSLDVSSLGNNLSRCYVSSGGVCSVLCERQDVSQQPVKMFRL